MKQGIKNIAKSINLSSLKNCVRPRQVQKLVSAEVLEPCTKTYGTTRPVTIRVCGRKDMERTCPPKLCDCPQEMDSKPGSQNVKRWMTFILKSTVVAGLVYWSESEGVWGDCNQTEDLYYRIVSTVSPVIRDVSDIDNIQSTHLENIRRSVSGTYNRAVIKVFGAIASVPLAIQSKIAKVFPCDGSENAEKAE